LGYVPPGFPFTVGLPTPAATARATPYALYARPFTRAFLHIHRNSGLMRSVVFLIAAPPPFIIRGAQYGKIFNIAASRDLCPK